MVITRSPILSFSTALSPRCGLDQRAAAIARCGVLGDVGAGPAVVIGREMKIVAGEILRRIEMQRVDAAVLVHVQDIAADQVGAAVRVVGDRRQIDGVAFGKAGDRGVEPSVSSISSVPPTGSPSGGPKLIVPDAAAPVARSSTPP